VKHGLLILCCALSAFLAGPPASAATPSATAAEPPSDCIHQAVTFDGIIPLTYAIVKSDATDRAALHHDYPQACDAGDNTACASKAYLVSGDTVAIGKTCGAWAHVQYIGEKTVTVGWVSAGQIEAIQSHLPFDAGEPPDENPLFTATTIHMRLVHGAGVPVCEAYLLRLNQTVFHEPPYCGRPENDQIPGFWKLNRIPLSGQIFRKLYGHVVILNTDGNSEAGKDEAGMYDKEFHSIPVNVGAWGYEPRVDIENSGTAANVVIWGAQPTYPACGDGNPVSGPISVPDGARGSVIAIVLTDQSDQIDDAKTKSILGHPTLGLTKTDYSRLPATVAAGFKPIGSSMGVFRYRDYYYFDTFFDGRGWTDFYGERAKSPHLQDHLAVFLRQHGVTRQVCELFFDDSTRATPFRRNTE
jgi:hypothetical protein